MLRIDQNLVYLTARFMNAQLFVNMYHEHSSIPDVRKSRTFFNPKRSFALSFFCFFIRSFMNHERSNKRSWIVFLNYWIWNEEPFRACKCTHEGRANDMKMESGQMHVLLSERTNELTTEWVYKCTHERASKCTYRLACKCMHKWPRDSLGRLYLSVCRSICPSVTVKFKIVKRRICFELRYCSCVCAWKGLWNGVECSCPPVRDNIENGDGIFSLKAVTPILGKYVFKAYNPYQAPQL